MKELYDESTGTGFDEFKKAPYEYILATYRGAKSHTELLAELTAAIPQERETMLSAAEQLRQEGRVEGIHSEDLRIAQRMVDDGVELERVQRYTGLRDEELAQLSPSKAGLTPQLPESPKNLDLLVQNIGSSPESASSGTADPINTDDLEIGTVSPAHKLPRNQ